MLGLVAALFFAAAPCEAPPVHVTGHGVPSVVVRDMQAEAPALERVVRDRLALTSCAPIEVELLPAIEGADKLEPPFLLPEWAAGAAEPGDRRIVVAVTAKGERQDRDRILLHELAHVGVREAAGGAVVPRWLDEGIARTVAGEDDRDVEVLARARVGDALFPLSAIARGFPGRSDLAALAYAESARAVQLIEEGEGGGGGVVQVLARLAAGEDIDDALAAVTGRRQWQLDVDVERSIPLGRAFAIVGLQTDLVYVLGALACAWAGIRARRQLRKRMAALDDDDAAAAARRAHLLPAAAVALARWTVRARG